ncbi:N-alpha-acetyltransferase 80-like [Ptychodera flava]|uniref:N-alpha-acetyltransferase 80-like n=1 Tax=Ptychodera flava TaxID=63121 RepID=UPI00396A1CD0
MAREMYMCALHKRPDLKEGCANLLNSEWPRSKTARLHSLDKSSDDLPYSLVMVEKDSDGEEHVLGHSRLCRVIGESKAVLIESVVVDKARRGQGLGKKLMRLSEQHAIDTGRNVVYLCTKDKQDFYQHIGYIYCEPVNTLGAQMLETCDCMPGPGDNLGCKDSCTETSSCKGDKEKIKSSCGSCQTSSVSCCPSTDSVPTAPSTGTSAPSAQSAPPPPPPPLPPPLKSVSDPAITIFWMKREIS